MILCEFKLFNNLRSIKILDAHIITQCQTFPGNSVNASTFGEVYFTERNGIILRELFRHKIRNGMDNFLSKAAQSRLAVAHTYMHPSYSSIHA